MSDLTVRAYRKEDKKEVFQLLAGAFNDENIFHYIFNKKKVEEAEMLAYFEVIFSAIKAEKVVSVLKSEGKVAGVLVYCPPGESESVLTAIPMLLRFIFKVGLGSAYRMIKAGLATDKNFARIYGDGYYNIQYFAIGEAFQKRGYSRLMLDHLTETASAHEGCKGVMVQTRDELTPFYSRCGFLATERVDSFGSYFNFLHLCV